MAGPLSILQRMELVSPKMSSLNGVTRRCDLSCFAWHCVMDVQTGLQAQEGCRSARASCRQWRGRRIRCATGRLSSKQPPSPSRLGELGGKRRPGQAGLAGERPP